MKDALALLLAAGALSPALEEKSPPNVILIMADDLGYRDLGCYGHPSIKTPNLDKLAAGGARLTGFHSGASVCTPSRLALLTGAYPVRLGWTKGVAGYLIGFHDGLTTEALTLAEIFQRPLRREHGTHRHPHRPPQGTHRRNQGRTHPAHFHVRASRRSPIPS